MRWICIVKARKTLIITINMTTIARRVNEDVRRRRNDDEMMGTVRPTGQIRSRRRNSKRPIGVGDEGGQGGGIGRESWRSILYTTHPVVRVTVFFSMTQCACLHA
jgi:hypothetical protein